MIKHLTLAIAALLVLSGSALAAANSLELNFNDESAQARFGLILSQDAYGSALLDLRGLYNDEKDRNFWLVSGGFDFIGEPGTVPGLELGIAADVKVGDSDVADSDFGAVGVGALARYYPPALGGFGVGARLLYSPEIFTFLEAERVTEFSTRVGYVITPRIGVHVEYQKVRVEFDRGGHVDIDDDVRVGFEARF